MRRRLKNSLRCALVVATLTRRQLRSTYSWISARTQCTANDTRRTLTLGIKALHGLHQADVAFLDQIADRQAVAGIAAAMCTTKRRCDSTSWRAASRSLSRRKRIASSCSSSRVSTGMRLTRSIYASRLPSGPARARSALRVDQCGGGSHRLRGPPGRAILALEHIRVLRARKVSPKNINKTFKNIAWVHTEEALGAPAGKAERTVRPRGSASRLNGARPAARRPAGDGMPRARLRASRAPLRPRTRRPRPEAWVQSRQSGCHRAGPGRTTGACSEATDSATISQAASAAEDPVQHAGVEKRPAHEPI